MDRATQGTDHRLTSGQRKLEGPDQRLSTSCGTSLCRDFWSPDQLRVSESRVVVQGRRLTAPGARIDVAAHLGAELATYGIENFVVEREVVRQEAINWKFVIDGFLEVYHFPTLHANSIAPYFHGKYSPFDAFGRNGRLVGVRASFAKIIDLPFDEMEFMPHIAVNYQIFPNTVLVWQGDHFEVWISSPGQAPNNSSVCIQSLTTAEMSGKTHTARWDRNWKVLIDTVVTEDWAISMAVQNSPPFVANDRIVFGRNEPGLQHFHQQLEDAVAAL
jgi:Ring hydroxylating alpha subunit (catalytic domain)